MLETCSSYSISPFCNFPLEYLSIAQPLLPNQLVLRLLLHHLAQPHISCIFVFPLCLYPILCIPFSIVNVLSMHVVSISILLKRQRPPGPQPESPIINHPRLNLNHTAMILFFCDGVRSPAALQTMRAKAQIGMSFPSVITQVSPPFFAQSILGH